MRANDRNAADRSWLARRRRRDLNRRGWIEQTIGDARRVAQSLRGCSPGLLREHTNRLRRYVKSETAVDDRRVLVLAAAGMIEAIRQSLGLNLFDVQLHAGIIVSRGAVAEMQTGEGKTLSVAMPAYVRALSGRGVHVATPNSYLAMRDQQKLAAAFELLGMQTGLLQDDDTPEGTQRAYRADITYGPGHAFGFDYLRDQLTLDRINSPAVGDRLYARLCGNAPEPQLLQRGLSACIIDEIDHVLIDDAVSPLLLSGSGEGESPDAEIHRRAGDVAEQLGRDHHFTVLASGVELTQNGFDEVYDHADMVIDPKLVRPWHEYVVLALRARHLYRRDVDYVLRDDEVQIVDPSTGRIFEDRTWSEGLHQAIEAREGLTISCETLPLARITRQRFYRYYESIGGMTGTAAGCEHEFAAVYGLPVAVVPLRIPSKRVMLPEDVSLTSQDKIQAIGEEVERIIQAGRAVLVGTLHIAESLEVAAELERRGLTFELLNGVQDANEADVVSRAGRVGAITVATNLAGRGTDIALDSDVASRGGLHVIVTQKHALSRVDRQLVGRSARCGDPGSARVFISADDSLVKDFAPWIGRAIARWAGRGRRDNIQLDERLYRVQADRQRSASAMRWRLLQTDRDDEDLLNPSDASPERCFQL